MITSTRRRLGATACAATVVVGVGLTGGAAASVHPHSSTSSVTVFLAAPHPSALEALATTADRLSSTARRQDLATLLPTAAERRTAIDALVARGLHVTGQTAWSVTADGASATLPSLPVAVASVASAVFPTTGGPPVAQPQALTGGAFRNAYASPAATAASQVPSDGADPNGPLTIATIQFSGWQSGDLSHYAKRHEMSLAAGQYKAVNVAGGATDSSGDEEVDLDQETLLTTAPTARQRAYFAPNTDSGEALAYSQVLDDVMRDKHSVGGGDSRIAALTSSWGSCEAYTDHRLKVTLAPIIASLEAAGVTVFNSTGDDGIYDCGELGNGTPTSTAQVDFPAAVPQVVAVGATELKHVGSSAPNNGTNWTETGWSCTTPMNCESDAGGGSGGGASSLYPEPTWQSTDIGNATYTSVGKRLVPDISDDGDPNTGLTIYTSDPSACGGDTTCVYGGTSLAAPESAALFTNVLAGYGRDAGIGDIHPSLYAGFAASRTDAVSARAFRDVTSGTNGAATNRGSDPSTSATTGYDTVSGLGSAIWPNLASYLLSLSAPPTVSTSLSLDSPHSTASSRLVKLTWHVGEKARGSGPKSAEVEVSRVGSPVPAYQATNVTVSGSATFPGTAGATYVATVTGTNVTDEHATATSADLAVPVDDKRFSDHGKWSRVRNPSDFAGSRSVTTSKNARAKVTATGSRYVLDVQTGPTLGRLAVYDGSKKIATVDLYSASNHHVGVTIFGSKRTARASRTLTFRPTGTKDKKSRGKGIDLDALVVLSPG